MSQFTDVEDEGSLRCQHAKPWSQRRMSESAESLVEYCRENRRVCPLPSLWHQLYEMLPNRRRVGGGWQPSLPLILAAWHEASALSKMLRLAEHIEWAEQQGVLDEVSRFLRGLREKDWYHVGE